MFGSLIFLITEKCQKDGNRKLFVAFFFELRQSIKHSLNFLFYFYFTESRFSYSVNFVGLATDGIFFEVKLHQLQRIQHKQTHSKIEDFNIGITPVQHLALSNDPLPRSDCIFGYHPGQTAIFFVF